MSRRQREWDIPLRDGLDRPALVKVTVTKDGDVAVTAPPPGSFKLNPGVDFTAFTNALFDAQHLAVEVRQR